MTMYSLSRDEKGRKRVVEKGGINCAVKLFVCFICNVDCLSAQLYIRESQLDYYAVTSRDQALEMTLVYITNALYEICYGQRHEEYPRHLFLRNAMLMMERNTLEMKIMSSFAENELIHVICHSA